MPQEPRLSPAPDNQDSVIRGPSIASKVMEFFSSRWRGEAPLAIVFWRDMVVAGTALNILAGVLALALYASDAPVTIVLIAFFAMLPWNLFLFLAVWRSANNTTPSVALLTRFAAAAWVIVALMI